MGLDMYLDSLPKIENHSFSAVYEIAIAITVADAQSTEGLKENFAPSVIKHVKEKGMLGIKWLTINEEHGYWRKANAIHYWFVTNVQNGVDNCEPYVVTKDNIIALRDDVTTVLNARETDKNNGYETAKEVLSTQAGFFFGGIRYDEYYYHDLEETLKICNDVLKDFDFDNNYLYYQSSW